MVVILQVRNLINADLCFNFSPESIFNFYLIMFELFRTFKEIHHLIINKAEIYQHLAVIFERSSRGSI